MAAHSKHYQTFSNRLLHLTADLELIDIFDRSIRAELLPLSDDKLFEKLQKTKHTVLANRSATKHNQQLAMNHLRQSVFSSYIKDLYEEVNDYLKSVLSEAAVRAKVTPERLIGDHRVDVKVSDILQADKLQSIIEDIVAKIFRKLENERSTTALIEKSCDKLGLTISEEIRSKAIYYLEIRHQLVHADGKADAQFKESHPDLTYTTGDYIDLKYSLIKQLTSAIKKFVDEFDKQAIEKDLVLPHT